MVTVEQDLIVNKFYPMTALFCVKVLSYMVLLPLFESILNSPWCITLLVNSLLEKLISPA